MVSLNEPASLPKAAAVFLTSPDSGDTASVRTAALVFGLTPAETRVIGGLLSVKTLSETATDIGIGHPTARTNLTRIFGNVGVSRQSELLRVVSGLLPIAGQSGC